MMTGDTECGRGAFGFKLLLWNKQISIGGLEPRPADTKTQGIQASHCCCSCYNGGFKGAYSHKMTRLDE